MEEELLKLLRNFYPALQMAIKTPRLVSYFLELVELGQGKG